jgi:hypothetical protein
LKVAEGQYIRHFQYGLGVITETDSERTSIDFDTHGMKKFVTTLMTVELAEGTPPKRPRAKRAKKAKVAVVAAAAAPAKARVVPGA